MWKHRKTTLHPWDEPHRPLYGMRQSPPYGITDKSEEIDALLNNADIYTLENLKNNPELLKPVNCTLLNPSDFEVKQVIVDINESLNTQQHES